MMSGLNNKDLMAERKMTNNYLWNRHTHLTSIPNIQFDDLDMIIDDAYPFLFTDI